MDGIAYVATPRTLYAVDVTTGTRVWSRHEFLADWTAPAVWKDRVYVGSGGHGVVRALDATTGRGIWSFASGSGVFNLTVADDTVFFIGIDGFAYALNARTGKLRWRSPVSGPGSLSNPTVAGGRVYVGSHGVDITVLDEQTGALLWTGKMGDYTHSTPAVVGGMVYVGSNSPRNTVFAFDADGCGQPTCDPVWSVYTGASTNSSPAVYRGTVFIGSVDGSLYALDAATGHTRWSKDFGAPSGFLLASPVIAGGVLFIGGGSDEWIWAVDPTDGEVLWSYETGENVNTTPAVVNGWVYVASFDQNLYAFHLPE